MSIPAAIRNAIHATRTRLRPSNLPRKSTQSGTGAVSTISLTPDSRSRQINSPAWKMMSSGMMTQMVRTLPRPGVKNVITSSVLGSSGDFFHVQQPLGRD